MGKDDLVTLELYLVAETPAARGFQEEPEKDKGHQQFWIPRSLIRRFTKYPAKKGDYEQCDVQIPYWKAAQLNLKQMEEEE